MKFRYFTIVSLVAMVFVNTCLCVTIKTEDDVLRNWRYWQKSYQDCSIREFKKNINSAYWRLFSLRYKEHKDAFKPMFSFLESFTHGYISKTGELSLSNGDKLCYDSLCSFYENADHDIPKLIEQLKTHQLASPNVNKQELASDYRAVIDRYRYFAQLLCAHPNQTEEDFALFSLGRVPNLN